MSTSLKTPVSAIFVLFIAGAQMAWAQGPDPGTPGPHAVARQEYNFGDTALTLSGFPGPIELHASITYPVDLASGPFPTVIFLHGRHATCFQGSAAFLEWPCTSGRQPIPSFQGYNYISDILASHGFIVVSISANGINAVDNSVFDLGALARAELIQKHLQILQTFNTTGGDPFGTLFSGAMDLNNVGTMGHSRGGEGVVRHFLLNASLGSPFGVKAVFPLAPVDFNRPVLNNASLDVMLPYCDGDVSDLQGVHYFDDARYNVPGDLARKHTTLVLGANHNFFNTIWTPGLFPAGTADDWTAFVPGGTSNPWCGEVTGNGRLSPEQQRGTGLAYIAGFFRLYLGGESVFLPMFKGAGLPPPSAMTTLIFQSYHAPDDPQSRLDVNRLLDAINLSTNTLGGAVIQSGLSPYDLCGGLAPEPRFCLPTEPNTRQPHTTPSARAPTVRGLSQLRFGWSDLTAAYENKLPPGSRNVGGFAVLQFRVSVNYFDPRNTPGVSKDFAISLTDGSGNSAMTLVSSSSRVLFFPPGSSSLTDIPVPKIFLNTARIPLSAFSGVNLNNIRSIDFLFDQQAQGALFISDLAFAD
jgi:hypothetical protein